MRTINHFLREQRGTTAIEYGLYAGLFVAAWIAALSQLDMGYESTFGEISSTLDIP
jgi:Flp pilus assembly pilin Flp